MRIIKEKKNHGPKCHALPIREDIANWFCFTGPETEMDKIKDDSKIKKANEPRSPRSETFTERMPPSWPPWFSLLTTGNVWERKYLPQILHKMARLNFRTLFFQCFTDSLWTKESWLRSGNLMAESRWLYMYVVYYRQWRLRIAEISYRNNLQVIPLKF